MKIVVETASQTLEEHEGGKSQTYPLYSREAFEILSRLWLRVGWDQKYTYTFTWMARPIIQLPQDLLRIQEVIYRVKPDVIIETGIAHGGSLVFYASLCRAMGRGRVIGIDIDIRPHNREAILSHEMAPSITLVEGSSTDPAVIQQVRQLVRGSEQVMAILDSDHSKSHVLAELEAYGSLVTSGSYLVATDGIMQDLCDVPRGKPRWAWDNPSSAAREFAATHPEFVIEEPSWPFNESELAKNVTHWPDAWLRRL